MISFKNSYEKLPDRFFEKTSPSVAKSPELVRFNQSLSSFLGIEMSSFDIFSGKEIHPNGSYIAMAYAGHQFGHFVPRLGDGRAILLGEVESPHSFERYDLHLKGSGRTPFSRNGDGRAALGPVLREYLISEAMSFLGVPTTRALCAMKTGETVLRDEAYPGAILTRVAKSHLRVGTFQYFAAREDLDGLRVLADYSIKRLYPQLELQSESVYLDFWKEVRDRQLQLVAYWLSLGFIHGVMNTDNTSISGETLDYGPCAFMESFNSKKVFSSIDQWGRYSYQNQVQIIFWNLARLADCLIPLVAADQQKAISLLNIHLQELPQQFNNIYQNTMIKKFGLFHSASSDETLYLKWFQYLEKNELDFTWSFRELSTLLKEGKSSYLKKDSLFADFFKSWEEKLTHEGKSSQEVISQLDQSNPCFLPRNHLMEEMIQKSYQNDFSLFVELLMMIETPFEIKNKNEKYLIPQWKKDPNYKTFCGT
jgi:uncharacterized protein YdiU (UPF0061 family)